MSNHQSIINTTLFKVTAKAAGQFSEIFTAQEIMPAGVRIYNKSGCCGASVGMELAKDLRPGEKKLMVEGVPFFVADDFLPELSSLTIDFTGESFRLIGLKPIKGCCRGN